MLKTLNNFFIGTPAILPEQRSQILAYIDDISAILGFQNHQGDVYLNEPDSAQAMVYASNKLALCAQGWRTRRYGLSI